MMEHVQSQSVAAKRQGAEPQCCQHMAAILLSVPLIGGVC